MHVLVGWALNELVATQFAGTQQISLPPSTCLPIIIPFQVNS